MAMNVASLTFLGAAKVVALAGIALAQDSCNSFSNRGNGCWCYTHGYRDSELVLLRSNMKPPALFRQCRFPDTAAAASTVAGIRGLLSPGRWGRAVHAAAWPLDPGWSLLSC